jgi:dipeptidase
LLSVLLRRGLYRRWGKSVFHAEDQDGADENKLYLVTPAGTNKAGDHYQGCFGFTWIFTHDNYRYLSRRDDNLVKSCPNCEGTHDHWPFEEAGTNECGVTVSATQSLYPNEEILAADPFAQTGINEAEIATVLLSEAASAREGVELLKRIVETDGVWEEGFGVMICDQKEQWYAEVCTGHMFLAVLLPRSVAFFEANVSVLGRLDLDDTEHIIASDDLIGVAQRAGTFVGDAEKNIIDYRLSFNDYHVAASEMLWSWNVAARMAIVLNELEGADRWNPENVLDENDFVMTNIAPDGSIVPLYNQLKPKEKVSANSLFQLMQIFPLGYWENEETHLYRFYPEADLTMGTVEWSAMGNNAHNVFIPGYPMLMTDTWSGYQLGLPQVTITDKKPDSGDYYEMDGIYYNINSLTDRSGEYHVYPEGWDHSYRGTFIALANALDFLQGEEEKETFAETSLAELQQKYISAFPDLTARLAAEPDLQARKEIMTREHMQMSEEAQTLALKLYRYLVYDV